jgi:hypothetical protein
VVSWVPQIVVPPLVALAFLRGLDRGWVMALAPTTFLADIDYLAPGEHRVYTHTLLIPAAFLGLVWLMWRSARVGRFWEYAIRPGLPLGFVLTAYYLTAHAIMDVFTGGVALLWPIIGINFYIDYSVNIDLVNGQVTQHAESGGTAQPFPLDQSYPWVTNEHSAIVGFVVAVGVCAWAIMLWRAWRAHRLSAPSKKGK